EKGSLNEMGRMDKASIWPDLQVEAVDIGDTSHQKYLERGLSDDFVEIDEDLFNKMMHEGERICKEEMELGRVEEPGRTFGIDPPRCIVGYVPDPYPGHGAIERLANEKVLMIRKMSPFFNYG
ncbi:hypothetical protein Dimus_037540, partial [Dionaea muscipula]